MSAALILPQVYQSVLPDSATISWVMTKMEYEYWRNLEYVLEMICDTKNNVYRRRAAVDYAGTLIGQLVPYPFDEDMAELAYVFKQRANDYLEANLQE